MGEFFNILGLVGSFVLSSAVIPQIRKIYRTKSATDISFRFQLVYLIGCALILIYGLGENLWPVYIPCAVECTGATLMMAVKWYYDGLKAKQSVNESLSPMESASEQVISLSELKSDVEDESRLLAVSASS